MLPLGLSPGAGSILLAPGPLTVEARFRGLLIASRLLVGHEGRWPRARAAAGFGIGAGRTADAPVNPAYVGGALRHPLVSPDPRGAWAGWVVSLAPAMRAELCTDAHHLPIAPDPPDDTSTAAAAPPGLHAPLALRPGAALRIPCGEMAFEIRAAGPHAALPRPWLAPGWRREGGYLLAAVVALLLALLVLRAVPGDPKSLSLDDVGPEFHLGKILLLPPVAPEPPPLPGASSGGSKAAAGPSGAAGDRRAPHVNRRMAAHGPADNPDPQLVARKAAEDIKHRGILGLLRPEEGSALASVLANRPALGRDAAIVLGDLTSPVIGSAYGPGGLGQVGTGADGAGTGRGTIGGIGKLNIIGPGHGPGDGDGPYGHNVGRLHTRVSIVPGVMPGIASVRGSIDREVIRRIVRLHINEVRFCYEQELPRHPELAGRLVVGFTITGNGQVISSVTEPSSTLADPRVASCVTQAVLRWPFPKPTGGGLVMVSYPFQLQPAGGG
jgi:hypothetical protein